jgi:triosephosphate isomerase
MTENDKNTPSRGPLIVANWKMNLGRPDEALGFVRRIRYALSEIPAVKVALAPPFTVLVTLADVLRPTAISLAAQNLHWQEKGAQTGEISAAMVAPYCRYAILGHSERRAGGETDEEVRKKTKAALEHGLRPIVCVGESSRQKQAGETHDHVVGQVTAALADLDQNQIIRCVLAYEPIWAIGSGEPATPADANRVIGLSVRGAIASRWGEQAASAVPILYGGSVDSGNARDFLSMPDIDGALVGGASLEPSFVELVRSVAGEPSPTRHTPGTGAV